MQLSDAGWMDGWMYGGFPRLLRFFWDWWYYCFSGGPLGPLFVTAIVEIILFQRTTSLGTCKFTVIRPSCLFLWVWLSILFSFVFSFISFFKIFVRFHYFIYYDRHHFIIMLFTCFTVNITDFWFCELVLTQVSFVPLSWYANYQQNHHEFNISFSYTFVFRFSLTKIRYFLFI